ncbi:LysR substrate-binding domain-containing protein [Phaeobacter inhibens]|uniref:LysR substrate-binding domain-containing protein n=1 Tax=Phaeobacter inhibens TaxID=221822 RepID=UPI0021A3D0A1|nr:LysR substrate-binding domain-containing protein [Phaeobacter inhibens]UWR55874.1 LysR family transcriptional regulator [Phaeobacter inhibens]UWR59344.1 LysR family transcriptional regulator [Phaeobacter inhibens]UWR63270.1 LysR family transcriptional regulator [Phaeobacter inhibens]UWR71147.1 LysR family transcriptional regulator [Phaeobacter inhibens]UWR98815.1 LysR family transcriptional regulator [Phaeobacter inhibens]
MLETPDLKFFTTLAAAPSLAAAARELEVTPSAVSQRLAQIEARLGLRLVERGRGPVVLTAEGDRLVRRAKTVLTDLSRLNDELVGLRGDVAGPLRIIAPFGFGRIHIAPIIGKLALEFPSITPDLVLSDDPYGAAASDNWDIIIHIGQLADSSLVQRKLTANKRFLCATPDYLKAHGEPRHPQELLKHACGVIREDQADVTMWSFKDPKGSRHSIRIRPAFASNDGEVVKAWACQGLGIVMRSEWSIARELRENKLRLVMEDYTLSSADVIALVSPKSLRTKRVEHLIDKLIEECALNRPGIIGGCLG